MIPILKLKGQRYKWLLYTANYFNFKTKTAAVNFSA